MENYCPKLPTVISFMAKDIISLSRIFSIFLLTRPINLMVYLKIVLKQVFYMTEILFFVLMPRYYCFGVTYVSSSLEPHLYPQES